jgi:hypothetical protein
MDETRNERGTGAEERSLGSRGGRLEETRRGVEKMAVEEQGHRQVEFSDIGQGRQKVDGTRLRSCWKERRL